MALRFISGDKVDSVTRVQKNDNRMFNKVVADVYKQIKYKKRSKWCYLPSKDHLISLIERLDNEFELEIQYENDYIMVRKK